jgi:hypothetical protein
LIDLLSIDKIICVIRKRKIELKSFDNLE